MQRDFQCAPQNQAVWADLVSQPEPLTERSKQFHQSMRAASQLFVVWKALYPQLVPLLETNRAHNEAMDRKNWLDKRQRRADDLFYNIRKSFPPFVEIQPIWPKFNSASEPNYLDEPKKIRINMPFPATAELLTWFIIQEIIEGDTSTKEMVKELKSRRADIDQALSDWRAKMVQDLLEIWRTKPEDPIDSLAGGSKGKQNVLMNDPQQAKDISSAQARSGRKSNKGKERALSSYDWTCGSSLPGYTLKITKPDGTKTDSIDELSDAMRLLFRPDTVFYSDGLSRFFPALVPTHDDSYNDSTEPDFGQAWDPTKIKRDRNGAEVTRALLERLGLPDASYFQMRAASQTFECRRCSHEILDTWELLVS